MVRVETVHCSLGAVPFLFGVAEGDFPWLRWYLEPSREGLLGGDTRAETIGADLVEL